MNNIKKLGNRQILFLTILVVLAVSLTGSAYADNYVGGKPLETVQEGNVTGDLAVDSYYGFNATDPHNVTYTFNYTIPSNAKIKNATLYVLAYSGHMQEPRQTYINVTYNGQLLDNQSLYTTYNYLIDGGNNNTWLLGPGHDEDPYLMINNHTMRVTSDYLLWYDVTNMTNESNWANVCTTGSYDGRIKLITLVVAYNLPGSTTGTRYWINLGHDVSSYLYEEYTGETYFTGTAPGTIKDATLMIVHAASQDGIYTYNNQNLPNGTYQRRGTYSGYEIWNVTDLYNNETNKFTYHKSPGTGLGGYYKIILAIQKIHDPNIDLCFKLILTPGSVFTLENNTFKVQIKNNGTETSSETTLYLYANEQLVGTATIPPIQGGKAVYVNITDPTKREARADTLYPGSETVTYKLVIDPLNYVAETNETNNEKILNLKVLYNGYKGKRWVYNGSDVTTKLVYDLNGGIAYYVQPDTTYASGTTGWSNYTVTFNGTQPSIPENATPIAAWLYVPYNWDNKGTDPREGAALTYLTIQFNQAVFQPGNYTRWYWDQSNFGAYANYKYGLLVYNVTEYYNKNQDNTVNVTLSVPASQSTHTLSMYPFTLLVIYNDNTAPRRQIFIAEEYDVLLLDPQFGVSSDECVAYVNFPRVSDKNKIANATYYAWATHAGPDEGNVYFNNQTLGLNVWQGNSKTAYPEIFNVKDKLLEDNNTAVIQGTSSGGMGAILQILVIEYNKEGKFEVNSVDPANGAVSVPSNKTIVVTFSNNILDGPGYANITVKMANGTAKAINKTISGNKLYISSINGWNPGVTFTVTIPANAVKNIAGSMLATTYTSKFTGAINVVSISPANGAVSVPSNKTIVVTFSNSILDGPGYANITVKMANGTAKAINKTISGNKLYISSIDGWNPGVTFTVTIPANAVKNIAGSMLATTYTSKFTTVV